MLEPTEGERQFVITGLKAGILSHRDAEVTIMISRLTGRSPHDVYTALGESEIVTKMLIHEYMQKFPHDIGLAELVR